MPHSTLYSRDTCTSLPLWTLGRWWCELRDGVKSSSVTPPPRRANTLYLYDSDNPTSIASRVCILNS
ncbi:MAG: hypothetical protein U0264_12825 [Candidatus Kapaibacterium sp.]